MKSDAVGRMRGSSAIPIVLLFLALATVFLFGSGRGHPYHGAHDHHDAVTWLHMAVALNLSPEHGFLGLRRLALDDDGNRTYEPYNRFPVLGHALIKLATLPWPDDVSMRLSAARTLMLIFFAAAATLAYLALCRLTGNRWAALAATLLAFSSYYALYYNDMVATQGVIDLFAVMLVLHGVAAFASDGRFGQLLAKTCAALLLGWHVYALLLPFVALGSIAALRSRDRQGIRRHLTLGAVALAFGTMVLAATLAQEYLAFGGEVAPARLPSVESMLMRTGLAEFQAVAGGNEGEAAAARGSEREWPAAAARQLKRIAWSVPYAVGYFVGDGKPNSDLAKSSLIVVLGLVLAALVVAIALLLFLSPATRHRVPLAALALSGPCWAFGLPNQSWHPYEGMFDVGLPLALFALLLPRLDRLFGGRIRCTTFSGIAAVPVFALSSLLMARATALHPEQVAYANALASDVDAIRKKLLAGPEGKAILVSDAMDACAKGWHVNWKVYFAGHVFVKFSNRHLADYVVSERIEGAPSLTPGNRHAFLYDRASHAAALDRYERHAKHGIALLEAPGYDVYFVKGSAGNELLYVRDQCPRHQINDHFHSHRIAMGGSSHVFVQAWPSDANDLSADRQRFGFDDLVDFQRLLSGWRTDGKCYAVCRLPDYDTASIRTGSATRRRVAYAASCAGRATTSPGNAASRRSGRRATFLVLHRLGKSPNSWRYSATQSKLAASSTSPSPSYWATCG